MTYDRTRLKARLFDRRRARYLGEDAKLLLLRTDGGSARFSTKETVTEGWSADFSEFLGLTTFRVAKDDAGFNQKANEATHLIITDSRNEAVNNQLFEVNRETTVPAGAGPYWRIRAAQVGKRYVP